MPFYAVAKGLQPGVYKTWNECKKQIEGFKNAKYKKFDEEREAKAFVDNMGFITLPLKQNESKREDIATTSLNDIQIPNLVCRLNTLEEKLTSIVAEIGSIRNALHNFVASSVNGYTSKRKLAEAHNIDNPPKKEKQDNVDGPNFKYDADGFVEVYTDGACEKNGRVNAKAGLGVFFGEGHPLNTAEPVSGRATNNCGEIQAATKAIRLAKSAGITKLCIYTDSQFVINSMTQWITGWKRKGWKLSDGSPVKNKEDFEQLDEEARSMQIKWTYVKAHCGIFGNEMADQLACQGAKMYKIN